MAAARKPWTDLLDGPGKPGSKEATPAAATATAQTPPTTVYMHTLVGNPDNPRTDADYTDDDSEFRDLKESMKSVGQLQPAVAVSREAFLRIKPEHGPRVGDAQWVVVLGNRRFHAAKQLGWTKFEIRVRDRLAGEGGEGDDKVDEAVVIENIHRKNIPPYKEAEFLQRMVERHGSQEKVAARIGKSQMYVSNRLSLLNLAPELQEAVDTKQIKVKTAERIAKLEDPEQQKAAAAEEIRKAQQPRSPRKRTPAPASPPVQNLVLNLASEPEAPGAAPVDGANPGLPVDSAIPEPRLAETPAEAPGELNPPTTAQTSWDDSAMPWQDPQALSELIIKKMTPKDRVALTMILIGANSPT
ncbi:ParB/RepB/Spo0J family partition protein [Streptomyces sp. NPDC001389]|uniref:ParB/RepB/Spo0J family partition protein n=1 Tax=Streptomyces sp. NPDC001389 TaxID=3364569 RepID=UPI003677FD3E